MKFLLIITFFIIFSIAPDVGAIDFWVERIDDSLKSGDAGDSLDKTIIGIVAFLVSLFYFIALVLGIYAGFVIMTSGGDEERVKKGKNIFIYVVIGLIVVFLASAIINFVIWVFSWGELSPNSTELIEPI